MTCSPPGFPVLHYLWSLLRLMSMEAVMPSNHLILYRPLLLLTLNFPSIRVFSMVLTLCDPMECSTTGLRVHHQLLEFTQTHAHWVSDAIQSSHPLSSPSSPTFNLSQHQGLSNESALPFGWPKYWSFSFSNSLSNELSWFISLGLTGLISLHSKGNSRIFCSTTILKHPFFSVQPYLWTSTHFCAWLLE